MKLNYNSIQYAIKIFVSTLTPNEEFYFKIVTLAATKMLQDMTVDMTVALEIFRVARAMQASVGILFNSNAT